MEIWAGTLWEIVKFGKDSLIPCFPQTITIDNQELDDGRNVRDEIKEILRAYDYDLTLQEMKQALVTHIDELKKSDRFVMIDWIYLTQVLEPSINATVRAEALDLLPDANTPAEDKTMKEAIEGLEKLELDERVRVSEALPDDIESLKHILVRLQKGEPPTSAYIKKMKPFLMQGLTTCENYITKEHEVKQKGKAHARHWF